MTDSWRNTYDSWKLSGPEDEDSIQPHTPECGGSDAGRCCYCAALLRGDKNPLDFRYGGPYCT